MQSITAEELKKRLSDGDIDEILVDVRENFEFKGKHIQGAKNIPLESVRGSVDKLKSIGTVYVHCASGNRSTQACNLLAEAGVNVVNIEGGMNAWETAGFAVVDSGKHVIPIIRQVMIVAGVLVLLGVVLGTWVNTMWHMLSAFVGGGLFFAGVSGICTMSYVLSKMPWNR
jgi:rhodanese-related sulfurtransferase